VLGLALIAGAVLVATRNEPIMDIGNA
jgi:hypothetical protein